jgi:hypothetical protein
MSRMPLCRQHIVILFAFLGPISGAADAAVFSHGAGSLERSGLTATHDYFIFSLDQPATLTATANWLFGHRSVFTFFVGVDDATLGLQLPSGFVIGPLPLGPTAFTRQLDLAAGLYIAVVRVPETDWDPGESNNHLVPFFALDQVGFPDSGYTFHLEGDFRFVKMLEGNLDGTFTETIPEPSVLAALAVGMTLVCRRRRRRGI